MHPELYRAATMGDWDVIERFKDKLDKELTSDNDTVLHVLSQFCDSSYVVEQIIQIKPKLLLKMNARKESLLHIAARKGHLNIVQAVINYVTYNEFYQFVFISQDLYGNLALHEAVKNSRHEIIRLLLKEGYTLKNSRNKALECPLYIAVARGDKISVALIISSNYRPPSYPVYIYCKPTGRTPLHAGAIWNYPECFRLVLNKFPELTKILDNYGRTALHYAARFNHEEVARELLLADRSIGYVNRPSYALQRDIQGGTPLHVIYGYIQRKIKGTTALHVAVMYGHMQIIELLLTYCPDCWSNVTDLRENVIHIAVQKEQQQVLDFILKKPWASELVNNRNAYGSTPLHLYVKTTNLFGSELLNFPGVELDAMDRDGHTPLDLLIIRDTSNDNKERQGVLRDELEKTRAIQGYENIILKSGKAEVLGAGELNQMAETYKLIATLIITISFAAAFTVPGGYESNDGPTKGQPVFLKKAAFIAFVVFDAMAMFGSMLSLTFLLMAHRTRHADIKLFIFTSGLYIKLSLLALIFAFVAGLFVSIHN